MPAPVITTTDIPSPDAIAAVSNGLNGYNVQQAGTGTGAGWRCW